MYSLCTRFEMRRPGDIWAVWDAKSLYHLLRSSQMQIHLHYVCWRECYLLSPKIGQMLKRYNIIPFYFIFNHGNLKQQKIMYCTYFQALADPYFRNIANVDREPSAQPVTKLEFEFERRRITKEDIRELIYRDILEYHPNMLREYLEGTESAGFMYPRCDDF